MRCHIHLMGLTWDSMKDSFDCPRPDRYLWPRLCQSRGLLRRSHCQMLWEYFPGCSRSGGCSGSVCDKPKPSQKPFSSGSSTILTRPPSPAFRDRSLIPLLTYLTRALSQPPPCPRVCSCPGQQPGVTQHIAWAGLF